MSAKDKNVEGSDEEWKRKIKKEGEGSKEHMRKKE
jgi:hypothetical protein